jgi:hypothetical protein
LIHYYNFKKDSSMSTVSRFKFSSLLDESGQFNGLHDVVFVILDATGEVAGEIKAHKLLLSTVSEVFKVQFFGPFPDVVKAETGVSRVEVNDASLQGFQTVVSFIYAGDETLISGLQDLDLLFEIYRLADKYLLPELRLLAKSRIEVYPLSSRNYAAVLRTISQYENLQPFVGLSEDLKLRCAVAVRREWASVADCMKFISTDYEDDQDAKMALMQIIADPNRFCHLCSPPKRLAECRDGERLTPENCQVGTRVRATVNMCGATLKAGNTGVVAVYHKTPTAVVLRNGEPLKLQVTWSDGKSSQHSSLKNIVIQEH